MTKEQAKKKIKVGTILVDDVHLVYKVLEVFENTFVAQPLNSCRDVACDIITWECVENEGWRIAA